MPSTVKPEFEELEKEFKKRWPDLCFFDRNGNLNGYGEIAKRLVVLEDAVRYTTL